MAKRTKYSVKRKNPLKKRLQYKKTVKHGYLVLGGTARKYKNVKTGKIISRRQFEKLFPPTSLSKYLGRKKAKERVKLNREAQARYDRLTQDYIRKKRREGFPISKRAARQSSDLKLALRGLRSKNPDRKAQALYDIGRIRSEDIVHYVQKFEGEGGSAKIKLKWKVVSKRTGATVFEGTYRECVRWLAFGTRKQRFKLVSVSIEDEGEDE